MKILILQLARLGDIYQTWPVLRALRETYPDAQIDLAIRYRFRFAAQGLDEIDRIWMFQPQSILRPVLENEDNWRESLRELDGFIQAVRNEGYDRIINLTFSPMSSFLTHALQSATTQVCGYTRSSDGYLSIPDDGSAYFYAQVGIGCANRVHLCDLFANVCTVDLAPRHWTTPTTSEFKALDDYLVVHLGASQKVKTYSSEKWTAVIRHILKEWSGRVVLIGSEDDGQAADYVVRNCSVPGVLNFAGRTELFELFALLKDSRLLIGSDSAPIHIASLTGTPCLNLSFDSVNFWETGPRSDGSRILYSEDGEGLASDRVAQEALQMLHGAPALSEVILARQGFVAFDDSHLGVSQRRFEWELTAGLYMGTDLPKNMSESVLRAFAKLLELNGIATSQLLALQQGHTGAHVYQILDQVDETIEVLTRVIPETIPLVRWYQTEKVRLLPMPIGDLIAATLTIHDQLQQFLFSFIGLDPTQNGDISHDLKAAFG